jgi:hypothetical protein
LGILIISLKFKINGKILPRIFLIAAGALIFWEALDIFSLSLFLSPRIYIIVMQITQIVRSTGLLLAFMKFTKYAI